MQVDPRVERLRGLEAAGNAIRSLPPRGAFARETRRLWRAEIVASTMLSGSRLTAGEVDALLDRGQAQGNHRFEDYVLVRGYAEAARWILEQRSRVPGENGPLLSVDDLRQIHTHAVAGVPSRGGAWRLGNPPPRGNIVAPAAWLVPREVETLVDRFGRGPRGVPVALWVARFAGRLARIRPFENANGRVVRLASNLLVRRLDLPPIIYERRERGRFANALAASEADAPLALAELIASAVVRTCNHVLAAASTADDPLLPLRDLAESQYAALAKAAQRGRLRTVVRGGRYFTTRGWIAEYAARRSPASAPAVLPPW